MGYGTLTAMAKRIKPASPAQLQIVYWKPSKLKPYAGNPRINDHAIPQMVASIQEFGFTIPILARSNGLVVDGHLRLKAALELKLTSVPVIVCDGWTEVQVRAFRLQANRSASWAQWDNEKLAAEIQALKVESFELDLTGFDIEELERLLVFDPNQQHGENDPHAEYKGMPEFQNQDQTPIKDLIVHFATIEDLNRFAALVKQPISQKTKYIWFPELVPVVAKDKTF